MELQRCTEYSLSTKWAEFAAGFKALVHYVVQTDYQQMAYLQMYLSPQVRLTISCLLNEPGILGDTPIAKKKLKREVNSHQTVSTEGNEQRNGCA